jgi:hypothetical protein
MRNWGAERTEEDPTEVEQKVETPRNRDARLADKERPRAPANSPKYFARATDTATLHWHWHWH